MENTLYILEFLRFLRVHKHKIQGQEVEGDLKLREEKLLWSRLRVWPAWCRGQRDGKGLPTEAGGLSVPLPGSLLAFLIELSKLGV